MYKGFSDCTVECPREHPCVAYLFLLSVDVPWQTVSFGFSSISLTPVKMKLALKLLAGHILPEVLQKVGFGAKFQTCLLVLS